MDDIRVGEMFAGIGGFRLAFERAGGFRVVWANEIDKYACQVYRRHFGSKELVEGDIREVKTADIPDIDLLCAGFPCQTFSVASTKRKGTGESRGTLFAQIVRVASAKRPKLLLLENVRGLLSSSAGRDFAVIIRTLGGLGYILQWEVLNSKHYGVAQNRERVFIVGHLGRECFRQVFPIREDVGGFGEALGEAQGEGARLRSDNSPSIAGAISGQGGGNKGFFIQTANTLSSRYGKDGSECLIQLNDDGGSQVNRIYSPDGLSPTVPTACGGAHIPKISTRVGDGDSRSGSIRMLTPRECERLQGFPDGWTEGVSDTQRYKLLGNAVTVNVVQYVAGLLL